MAELKKQTVAASFHSKERLQGERCVLGEYLFPSLYCHFMGVRKKHGYHLFIQASMWVVSQNGFKLMLDGLSCSKEQDWACAMKEMSSDAMGVV